MKQRLQKILSHAGISSRRAAEALILEGRVTVDGNVIKELGSSADPDTQDVRVDGSRVRARPTRRYVALNKPPGYVTTRSDPSGRKTVMELLPISLRRLFPVGRLDMGSSGLLVLTDDGELAQRLTHPKYQVEKTYLVTIEGTPLPAVMTRAARGIVVDGERLVVDRAQILTGRVSRDAARPRTRLRVTLRQGRNREIRRLFGALGHPVIELHREQIGTLSVRGMAPGAFRTLSTAEVAALQTNVSSKRPRRTRVK
jgi:23S rRNA pseudouridine2605 synthase